ncbi:Stp1/IreP family PP2C-type Ser/Thr phosphatase [Aquabacterium sp. A08]|uniref:Stp1/IreP family PP2C-type Ser/Thr phosphatase n=1 Tax=Aquabacterium sp. A08 TaxID=2718532 RepID=UPI001420C108|nr:Stp1/IreP family PP2C-type Ser/Thr phosphatase [Aquabacterium sp. A08]NIC41189.1 Stp1/IreP family PP2C-type Ser/Thr phosphatase [Aquabacterium sp. A08]
MKCDFFSLSDRGRVRANNEDAVAVDRDLGLAVLADGMGGYNAGEVASALATAEVQRQLRAALPRGSNAPREVRRALQHSVEAANLAIYEAALSRPDWRGMATTLVVALFGGARLTVGHVGDSRLYRLRQGQLALLTRDHSLLQEQIDAGLLSPDMARVAQYKNLVTRAVGVEPLVALELSEHVVQAGDTYLLCSDGLNDMLSDGEIAQILTHAPPLAQAGQALLDAANAAGGRDNISLVLVQCSPDTERQGLLARLLPA